MKTKKNENQLTGVCIVRVFTGMVFRTGQCVTSKGSKTVRVLANWSFKTDLNPNFDRANLRKSQTKYSLLRQRNLYYQDINMRHIANVSLTKFLYVFFVDTSYNLRVNIKSNALNFQLQKLKLQTQVPSRRTREISIATNLVICFSVYLTTLK